MKTQYILTKAHLTEKSLQEAGTRNRYTFEVDIKANKHQIKEVVEDIYGVTVASVRTKARQSVEKRTGRKRLPTMTSKKKYAIVELVAGQSIPVFESRE